MHEPPELSRAAVLAPEEEEASPSPAAAPAAADDSGGGGAAAAPPQPSTRQLMWVAFAQGIPFVAFGFCDNFIMITAGEQIDLLFGARLGLSSMAAAGLGNCVADVVGINISHSIERRTKGSKFLASGLSAVQKKLSAVQRAKGLGCAVGMATGCLLGLVPLLFIDTEAAHSAQAREKVEEA
ncbi:MAG: hypothetical protein J3K34DRAFT_385059 [Monoraphidium minutum]|nr:MAG: hypothetical protein J3K34DRAFT_385059 [Monoraphidium minutum]